MKTSSPLHVIGYCKIIHIWRAVRREGSKLEIPYPSIPGWDRKY